MSEEKIFVLFSWTKNKYVLQIFAIVAAALKKKAITEQQFKILVIHSGEKSSEILTPENFEKTNFSLEFFVENFLSGLEKPPLFFPEISIKDDDEKEFISEMKKNWTEKFEGTPPAKKFSNQLIFGENLKNHPDEKLKNSIEFIQQINEAFPEKSPPKNSKK